MLIGQWKKVYWNVTLKKGELNPPLVVTYLLQFLGWVN